MKGIIKPGRADTELLLDCFGRADTYGLDSVSYTMKVWPGHSFRWARTAGDFVSPAGFEKRFSSANGPELLAEWLRLLQPYDSVMADVRTMFGEPKTEASWGNLLEWSYSLDNGQPLVLHFDYQLLTEITSSQPML